MLCDAAIILPLKFLGLLLLSIPRFRRCLVHSLQWKVRGTASGVGDCRHGGVSSKRQSLISSRRYAWMNAHCNSIPGLPARDPGQNIGVWYIVCNGKYAVQPPGLGIVDMEECQVRDNL